MMSMLLMPQLNICLKSDHIAVNIKNNAKARWNDFGLNRKSLIIRTYMYF